VRLGYHYHIPAMRVDGKIHTSAQQGIFIENLAKHTRKIVCYFHTPRIDEIKLLDYTIKNKRIKFINIGPHKSVYFRELFANKYLTKINLKEIDILLVRGPSVLLPALIRKAGNIPTALILVGDYVDGISELPQPFWRLFLIYIWARYNRYTQNKLGKKSLIFVNNKLLFERYSKLNKHTKFISTTLISNKQIYFRSDTCQGKIINIIYAGRVDRQKGIFDIANAIILLLEKGYNIVFDLIGVPDKKDNVLKDIKLLFESDNRKNNFNYYGFIPFGEKLFQFYRNADIFVNASRLSEGFPRTIWEALSHSLPVITTAVGGIPYHVKDNKHVLFCETNNPESISVALENIINDSTLRKKLIHNGIKLTQSNTIEKSTETMIYHLKQWMEK